jgi:proline iminopeptidase
MTFSSSSDPGRPRLGRIAWTFLALGLGGCLDPGDPGNLVPQTVVEDPSLPRIEVNGTILHAEAFGQPNDPMIMVLHGGPGADYRSLLPLRSLADDGYYVAFWDQRGGGLSQRHDADTYYLDLYLEDLRAVIDHYSTSLDQPYVFIGHSWGAMYATWFINEFGDDGGRLRGAVLSEPGGFSNAQLQPYLDRLLGSLDFIGEQVNDAAWLGQFMSAGDHQRADYLASAGTFGGVPAERLDPNNPTPSWRSGAVVSARLLELGEQENFDWTTNLSAFDPRVLFLRGDLNEAATLEHQRELASGYPNAEIVTIPNVGHEMVWERPVEYLAETTAYFREIGFTGDAP